MGGQPRLCERCGKPRSQAAAKLCRQCWFATVSQTAQKGLNWVEHVCRHCQTKFSIRPYAKQKGFYCSRPCADEARRKSARERYESRYKSLPFYEPIRRSNAVIRFKHILVRCKKFGVCPPSQNQFIEWYHATPKQCVYCDAPEETLELINGANVNRILHVDRMDNARGYEIDNIVFACGACNVVKNAYLTYNEMREVGQRFMKPKWQRRLLGHQQLPANSEV